MSDSIGVSIDTIHHRLVGERCDMVSEQIMFILKKSRGVVAGTLANASKSFVLAAVSVALDVVSAKFAAVCCWRTVVSLAAARARLSRAVPKRSMEAAGAGRLE